MVWSRCRPVDAACVLEATAAAGPRASRPSVRRRREGASYAEDFHGSERGRRAVAHFASVRGGRQKRAGLVVSATTDWTDYESIRGVLYRYCRGVDRLDKDLLRSCFHPNSLDQHGAFSGSGEEFVTWVLDLLGEPGLRTQHAISNVMIEIDGERARVESVFTATRLHTASQPARIETFWGRYLDKFERRSGKWAVVHRRVIHDGSETRDAGPPMDNAPHFFEGRRDTDDVSYQM
jgi:hypothetical protein